MNCKDYPTEYREEVIDDGIDDAIDRGRDPPECRGSSVLIGIRGWADQLAGWAGGYR
ncbi:hypothetical protein [Streptomyces sp. NPDC007905]|uniref:hypothetical protein n=1 Tax=Streptomyces sp. NPDC007905 TaxID=3364788 RepID=UPI0036EE1C10